MTETAWLASGCFWSKEYWLAQLPGVRATRTGFTGGHVANPTYRQVCQKKTGHAETVEVTFFPEELSYENLLRYFFNLHDPEMDRRAKGGQYRSAIFYHNETQHETAEKLLQELRTSGYQPTTELQPAGAFYPAGARHQKYCDHRGLRPNDHYKTRLPVNIPVSHTLK